MNRMDLNKQTSNFQQLKKCLNRTDQRWNYITVQSILLNDSCTCISDSDFNSSSVHGIEKNYKLEGHTHTHTRTHPHTINKIKNYKIIKHSEARRTRQILRTEIIRTEFMTTTTTPISHQSTHTKQHKVLDICWPKFYVLKFLTAVQHTNFNKHTSHICLATNICLCTCVNIGLELNCVSRHNLKNDRKFQNPDKQTDHPNC